ncbi:S8 family serine peptidase, partial [Roseateles sp.]|uniref:S8 family serine peptidase n=1 Tax=Roseateles sp. TaxID=1971397 RepID=UPI0039187DED
MTSHSSSSSRRPQRFSPKPVALALALLAAAGAAQAGQSVAEADAPGSRVVQSSDTDRLIVKYFDASEAAMEDGRKVIRARALDANALNQRVDRAKQLAAQRGLQLSLVRQSGLGSHVLSLDRALPLAEVEALAARIKAEDATVEYAEPDRKMYALLTPNDSQYNQQWDLSEATGGIRAPAAWDQATGTGVVVAVSDTGIRPHADLAGQTGAGYDMIADVATAHDGNGRDSDPSDPGDWNTAGQCGGAAARNSSWHGTHVAGTIAARTNNAAGIAGIAFNAKVQAVRVLGRCGGYN